MMIQANIKAAFGRFKLDADIRLPDGVTVVFGPSGCGKTSLLRAIAGLDKHEGSRISVGGKVWQDEKAFVPAHQRGVGYVFQEASLFDHLDVAGNISYGMRRVQERDRRISAEEAARMFGAEELLRHKPEMLSGGERQRVALARAVAASPSLLLMDEPLAALDFDARQQLLPYIERLNRRLGIPLVYVTHSLDEASRIADFIVLLNNGQVKASGDSSSMLTDLSLPMALGPDACAVVKAKVVGYEAKHKLCLLQFDGGQLSAVSADAAAHDLNTPCRLRIQARDVSLSVEPSAEASFNNVIPAKVSAIAPTEAGQTFVKLLAGDTAFLSCITSHSAEMLGIRPGMSVFAHIKNSSVFLS